MQEKTQSSQIKGELQLIVLNEAVEFITEKFDQYVADRKEKRENYRQFAGESFKNVEWITSTEEFTRSRWQQQYSRQNCILIHGISEQKGEDTDEQVLKIFKWGKLLKNPILIERRELGI